MKSYKILSALLQYPEPELIAALPELELALAERPEWQARLRKLFAHLNSETLIDLQQQYVMTFDRNPSQSLHLFEHIHGESRDRGQAMVDLLAEYRAHGMDMVGNDLPDYVPLFLEFLSMQDEEEALRLLGDAIHVLAHIGRKLAANGSTYSAVFDILEAVCPVKAEVLEEPPVRDMDEALETFGPGADGVEPLLKTMPGGAHPINFYPKAAVAPQRA
ncbi:MULTISPECIES: nitrate reductase molybdenum cofactor assembly chaperone [Rugamonas]|jgi:nitrate reductase delta subunit|uniref:Respiratory nitrate reductase chaperone NarJ n=1 Tax=Rugamonas rubra TaxID=758825 RepID=A0A1I4SVY8_9BURK|nr:MULTISPECIES: nitrate reductase molybdenum cofactor assembly chaperone [Rugamonas]WGG52812.1 nitrate reductase molybdenum cofactor assembly chaperone [Rugamonas sp. DEMB1]SFM68612.1 respiratory nitrate reductase chaperone NarJ [Rugamonas rubra]